MSNQFKWSLVRIPDHQGVVNVGGRVGAAEGPSAAMLQLKKFNGQTRIFETLIFDQVTQPLTDDIGKNHELASDLCRKALLVSNRLVVIGGGHDHGFSHLKGVYSFLKGKRLGCINIDAHLDVRKPDPLVTSGSPFYLALEAGIIRGEDLIEFGIQSHCNGPGLFEYARSKGVPIVPFRDLRNGQAAPAFESALRTLESKCDAIVISLDLDATAQCFAPGVSAPQAEGFSSSEIVQMVEAAGASKKVLSLGVFELNPMHDFQDQTARLAATAVYHFIESSARTL